MENQIPLTRLYEKTSKAGNRYFVGRIGDCRALLLLNSRAETDNPEWNLVLQPFGDKPAPC